MAFGRKKQDQAPDEAPPTEGFTASSDAEMALPADTPDAPPEETARVADVPPPEDVAALADTSAAAAAAQTATWARPVEPAPVRAPAPVWTAPAGSGSGSGSIAESLPVGSELVQQRPEVLVGAAFAGAFVFARILKHLTSE